MNWATPILEHSGILLAGGSAFLALGLLINLMQRTPILRIRVAEMAVGSALLFGVLTLAPLPRAFAPEPIALSTERPPLPAFDLAPILSLLDAEQLASTGAETATGSEASSESARAAGAATALATRGSADSPQLGPEHLLPEQPMAPLIETPLLFSEPDAAAATRVPYAEIAFGIWLAGAALAAAWLMLGAFRIRRVLRNSSPAPRHLLRLLRNQGVQFPRGVRLRLSEREVRPFCVGAFRPTVVIPRSLLNEAQSASLAPVVQHELAHASQGDARGLWLFAIALVPLWFHPLFWWLRAQHRFATELVADAIAADKTSNRAYARELMHLVECQAEQPTLVVGATALFRKRSDFYQRMQMLLTRNNTLATRTTLRRRALHGFLSLGLLTGAASVGGVTPASAQEPEQDTAHIIQQLQAENTMLRSDLQEMRVVLTELKDLLAHMQMQQKMNRKAEAHDRLRTQMDRMDAQEREVDAFMQTFDPSSPEQVRALAELGYMLVDDAADYLPYTVKAGDTVTKIAEMMGQRHIEGLTALAQLNPDLFQFDRLGRVSERRQLQPGMTVLLPLQNASIPSSGSGDPFAGSLTTRTHTVKRGESIHTIAKQHGLTTPELQKIFYKLNPELITFDANGHMASARPLKVGDKLQVPIAGQEQGSGRGGRRAVDGQGVPILENIPLVGDFFDSRGTESTQATAPAHQTPMPSVNLAECMELSFRAIDLQGELELAKAGFDHSERLATQGLVGELELQKSRIALVTLERKYGLSRSVVEARIHDLQQQVDELGSRYTKESPNFPTREIQLRRQAIEILGSSF